MRSRLWSLSRRKDGGVAVSTVLVTKVVAARSLFSKTALQTRKNSVALQQNVPTPHLGRVVTEDAVNVEVLYCTVQYFLYFLGETRRSPPVLASRTRVCSGALMLIRKGIRPRR
jgi:hypothetical protein